MGKPQGGGQVGVRVGVNGQDAIAPLLKKFRQECHKGSFAHPAFARYGDFQLDLLRKSLKCLFQEIKFPWTTYPTEGDIQGFDQRTPGPRRGVGDGRRETSGVTRPAARLPRPQTVP